MLDKVTIKYNYELTGAAIYKELELKHMEIANRIIKAKEECASDIKQRTAELEEVNVAVREAAAQGDRSENAEYTSAIEKRADLVKELNRLNERQRAFESYMSRSETSEYGGTYCLIKTGGATTYFCTLVPSAIGDRNIGALSDASPIGIALLNYENSSSKSEEIAVQVEDKTIMYKVYKYSSSEVSNGA